MAITGRVLCMCCDKYMSRSCERVHRTKARKLALLTTPTPRKRPRLAFKAVHTPCDKPGLKSTLPAPAWGAPDQDMQTTDPGPCALSEDLEFPRPSTPNDDVHHIEGDGQDDTGQILTTCMSQRWTKHLRPRSETDGNLAEIEQESDAGDCDIGNTADVPLEDGLSNDEYGMDDINSESDQHDVMITREELGEDFESKYAMIGASYLIYLRALKLTICLS